MNDGKTQINCYNIRTEDYYFSPFYIKTMVYINENNEKDFTFLYECTNPVTNKTVLFHINDIIRVKHIYCKKNVICELRIANKIKNNISYKFSTQLLNSRNIIRGY